MSSGEAETTGFEKNQEVMPALILELQYQNNILEHMFEFNFF